MTDTTPFEDMEPTPWYRTQTGETMLSVVGVIIMFASYAALKLVDVPYPLSEGVGLIGLLGLMMMFYFSGRAAKKSVENMMEP